MRSSEKGHLEITRFLVESGANVNAENKRYYTLRNNFTTGVHAAVPFNFSDFCYQWLHRVDEVL